MTEALANTLTTVYEGLWLQSTFSGRIQFGHVNIVKIPDLPRYSMLTFKGAKLGKICYIAINNKYTGHFIL